MKTKIIRISIIGFGNVGRAVAEVINRKRKKIAEKYGLLLKIVAVADLKGVMISEEGLKEEDFREFKMGKRIKRMTSVDVIKNVEHEVMVEATPTNVENGEPGLRHIILALKSQRNVVTSNKGPLALEYRKLMELARKNQKEIKFGATVGGGLPIISLLKNELINREIISIRGILNGTCNYILTRMAEEGLFFEQALKEAQELGIAEADPSKDVEGVDTAVKLVILANLVFDKKVSWRDVEITGIREITPEALNLAKSAGYTIKLIGEVNKEGLLKVAPCLIPKDDPLNVGGVFNVVTIKTDLAGDITLFGKGAGPIETASTILSDIIGIYRN